MVTDGQVKELRRLLDQGKTLATAARMTNMTEKTARHYRDHDPLPSQRKKPRHYRTRIDPFAEVWSEVQEKLEAEPRLKAVTLFHWLQQQYPGQFQDSTRRTFERRVAKWRSLCGPAKTVFFPQQHHAGRLAASDFTVCNDLGVRIAGASFDHMLFHCVLTYSNVESISLCFSESFEALSEGIQKAFWQFGGVPKHHRTDSLSAAVRNHSSRRTLTDRYSALMNYYGCRGERTNARSANENGDVESSHGHLKDRIDQALLLRGSRDFDSREGYVDFLEGLIAAANANRRDRFSEEQAALSRLPDHRLDTDDYLLGIRVSKSSTIQVRTNTYSVPSRLIGQKVDVRLGAEQIVVAHQGYHIQTMPRLHGKHGRSINYRHIIDSLVRKPGAFSNYKFREEMFPTSQFRIAYDILRDSHSDKVADRMYVRILEIAARESQDAVGEALRLMITSGAAIDVGQIRELVADAAQLPAVTDLEVETPDLTEFDSLLHSYDMESLCDDEESHPQYASGEIVVSSGGSKFDHDGPVPRTSATELPGSFSAVRDPSCSGEPRPPGVSFRIDDARMRDSQGKPDSPFDEELQAAAGQNVGIIQLQTVATECTAPIGNAPRRIVLAAPRKRPVIRQAGFREESCLVCVGRATDSAGSQHAVHHLRPAGSATADCQTGSASTEDDQTSFDIRGTDHRRPRLCPAEPGGDGSLVHAARRTVRTGQRHADQQSGIQQMGPDLQRCDDDCGSHRPPGPSQRNHRAERAELPSRNGQEDQIDNDQEWEASS